MIGSLVDDLRRTSGLTIHVETHGAGTLSPAAEVTVYRVIQEMLTTFDDDALIFAALQAGASGYVLKDAPSERLARDLHAVRRGASILSPSVARKVIATVHG